MYIGVFFIFYFFFLLRALNYLPISNQMYWSDLNGWVIAFNILLHPSVFLVFPLGDDIPPMQLKEGVFRCIMQLYDCLLTEVHERCKKGLGLAKYLNSSLAFFCYDLLSVIEPRQVFELVCFFRRWLNLFFSFYILFSPPLLFQVGDYGLKLNVKDDFDCDVVKF